MPYFNFDLVIGEDFKNQGGMILEDSEIAIYPTIQHPRFCTEALAATTSINLSDRSRFNGHQVNFACRGYRYAEAAFLCGHSRWKKHFAQGRACQNIARSKFSYRGFCIQRR